MPYVTFFYKLNTLRLNSKSCPAQKHTTCPSFFSNPLFPHLHPFSSGLSSLLSPSLCHYFFTPSIYFSPHPNSLFASIPPPLICPTPPRPIPPPITRCGKPLPTQVAQFSRGCVHSRLILHAPKHWWLGSFRAKWQCLISRRPTCPQEKWIDSY